MVYVWYTASLHIMMNSRNEVNFDGARSSRVGSRLVALALASLAFSPQPDSVVQFLFSVMAFSWLC
jgi:hypothetical protein